MKSILWRSLILGCLLLSACHGKNNQIHVVSRNFENEIEQQQNLVFTFNKDLLPDSLLQRWDTTAYIEFEPKVPGQFRWNSPHELVFSTSTGFEPSTDYTAKLTKALAGRMKKKLPVSSEAICFHTAPLKVTSTHVSWTRGKSMANVVVQLDLMFNYDVKVADAASHIRLTSNSGENIMTTTINDGTSRTVSMQFMPLNEKDEETPLKIEVLKDIGIMYSKNVHSKKDTTIAEVIPSRYNLEVTSAVGQHTGTEGIITVNTSQPLQEEGLKNFISVSPSVPFEVTLTDAGFMINSTSFKNDVVYEVEIATGLEGTFGGRLKEAYRGQVGFGELEPTVQFMNSKGMYLSSRGYKNIALNIVNVPNVEVSVIKVYENNLEHFFRRDQDEDYYYDEEEEDSHWFYYYNTENMGDTVFHQNYETNKLPKQNAARILHLDFKDKLKSYNGVYIVTVASKDHKWIQQSKILSISDVGLIVKEEKDAMYVFANSIRNATALPDVKISFISTNNQEIYTATTNEDGVAVFSKIKDKAPGFRIGMVTAKMGDEFSFVMLTQARTETSRFDVGGRLPNDAGLNAMIYAERDLYRPGEQLNASTIIRTEQWTNPGEMPIKFRLVMPNGKEFATMRKILNEEGSAETSFNVPHTALTGTYTLQVLSGNDVLLNDYRISIEEFMPDRMKVSLKTDKPEYKPGDSVRLNLQADNLFGTPAAGRNYESQLNINKQQFTSKNLPEYNFSIQNDFNFETEFKNGQTDDNGSARNSFYLRPEMKDVGILKGNVMSTAFDETGRPVHRYENFTVYTQPYFVGVKRMPTYVDTRKPMRIELATVDKNGNPQSGVIVQLSLIKKEWHTVIQQDGGSYRYVSQRQETVIRTQNLSISGKGAYAFTPELSGEYELRVAIQGSNSYVSTTFYAWGWGDTQYSSFEVDNEGNVDITMDKEKYNQGDDINLLFTTPFEGRMLVTLERDKVMQYYYLQTKNKSASLKIKADELAIPNFYVSATLIRPMDGTDMPLTVAHGFRNVTVENVKNHLPVQVNIAPNSRSKTKQTITVKTTPGAYVTIAAVDEGILQIKNYTTPDPYKYFYQKVALSTGSYDIYPLLLPEIKLSKSSTGGDGAAESDMRVNPMFVNRVKNVSFWSGIVQADGSGVVKYTVDIPQFSGDLRVMAVAYKGKGFGGSDQHMKVADPVVISAALPRFLSPKDEVMMPITLSNTTASDMSATVNVQTVGPLSVSGAATQTIKIPANREQRVLFNIAAQQVAGTGKVTVSVKTAKETFTNETEMSVRPAASLQKLFGSGLASANITTNVNITSNFIPATARGKLIVSKSPLAQFTKNLSELVHYPYGCVEQTTSAVFPQLYYADLVKSITGKDSKDANPAYNIQQAITKLQSMQLPNGSLSYWPGGGQESWWGSIYATHFLVEAKKAGYDVNAKTVERLLDYMQYRLAKRETEVYYYNVSFKKEIAPKEIPYSLYVLALAGKPQLSAMNYYKAHMDMLALDSKYMLAAAYTLSGQPQQAKQVLPPAFSGEKSNQSMDGSFYSYIRDQAIALNALLEIDPNNQQIGIMAKQLSEQLKAAPYLNTQENVWSILAFGKIARNANKTNSTATVLQDGRAVALTDNSLDLKGNAGSKIQVQVKGNGPWYYFWEKSGITVDGSYKQEDSYLKARRTFYNRSGKEITGNTVKQNDLIVVKITIESQNNAEVENIAITDMLPAGFEIENSRLTGSQELSWLQQNDEPDYLDVRDDRINMFTSLTEKPKVFYYMVRAVSPGTYQLGPVQADAMYNGAYHSYHGAGVMKVLP